MEEANNLVVEVTAGVSRSVVEDTKAEDMAADSRSAAGDTKVGVRADTEMGLQVWAEEQKGARKDTESGSHQGRQKENECFHWKVTAQEWR